MTFVERYYVPLCRSYKVIRVELSKISEKNLQFAVKSVNDSVGPEGLVPILLV